MSDTKLQVILSQKARQDFIDVLRYTAEQFGKAQLENYREKLDSAIQRIAQNPDIGAARHDLDQPYRTFPAGVHVIVYRNRENRIRIIRILHQRMDPASRY